MAILLFVHLTRHSSTAIEQLSCISGCETDLCVLQSCLGLLDLGYEVYVLADPLFSSSPNVDAAIARMKAEGAVFLTYKTLYYELIEAVEGRHKATMLETFRPFPEDL